MFGKKNAAKRQRVLEEMLWLSPVDRERRMIAAVASGEFSAAELESALRLVARLDALRDIELPGGRLVGGGSQGYVPIDVPLDEAAAPADLEDREPEPADREPVAFPIVPDPFALPVAVPVVPDAVGIPVGPEAEAASLEFGGLPIDALESAERWMAAAEAVAPQPRRARGERRALGPSVDWHIASLEEQPQLVAQQEDLSAAAWQRPA